MKILCIVAHPDDLELMAGGTIARWVEEGHSINVIVLTNGVWLSPDGTVMRNPQEALQEQHKASQLLGYSVENLKNEAMDLKYEDRIVSDIIGRIEHLEIDTIMCNWEGDLHHDHEISSRIAVAASRRIPRVLMGQVNFFLRTVFTPNVFVDVTATWEKKIEAIKCYKTQWMRSGDEWYQFLDEISRYYGRMVGVRRAEGFVSRKYLL